MNDSTRSFSGIGMSYSPAWMSDLTAFFSSALTSGGTSVADIASSSSIDAGSSCFSVKPSPWASAFTS